jgi:hypothetical protein
MTELHDPQPNPYAPPAEGIPLSDDQYVLSLENYALIMSHNDISKKGKTQLVVVGVVSLLGSGVIILLGHSWFFSLILAAFGGFLLKARFNNNREAIRKLYDQLKMSDKVMSFEIKDQGLLIREGRSYGFSPADEIDRIDIVNDLAIIVRNNVGLQGIHLRNDAIRSIIMKFKHDNSL